MRGKYPKQKDLEMVHTIKVPTATFAGSLDTVFAKLTRTLHELIAGSQLTIYEDVGHMLNLEVPDRFNADLKVFLEGMARS